MKLLRAVTMSRPDVGSKMKTFIRIVILLITDLVAFAQNPQIRNISKIKEKEDATVTYHVKDTLSIQGALTDYFAAKQLTKLTGEKLTIIFSELYNKSYHKGSRGITKILRQDIDRSKKKFFSSINNGGEIDGAKRQFRKEIDETYIKAINQYSRLYEKHSADGPVLLPGRNRFLTRYYFTNETDRTVEALSNGSFSFNTAYQGGSLYTELIAGYLSIFRISFGGMVAKSEVETLSAEEIENMSEEELTNALKTLKEENDKKFTAQNILAGGGNALVNASTPVFHYSNTRKDFLTVLSAFGRLGLVLPKIGTTSEDAEINSQYGFQFDIWHDLLTKTDERSFALFGKAMVSVFNNATYSRELGIHNGFCYVELAAGIEFNTRFRVGINFPFIYGDSRPSMEGFDAVDDINENLLKSTLSVTIIPFK